MTEVDRDVGRLREHAAEILTGTPDARWRWRVACVKMLLGGVPLAVLADATGETQATLRAWALRACAKGLEALRETDGK
ncbi:hypothetical protein [Sutterella sp.]|uniref:hypothetical protein n=1 Tax=Sutterella sp. TaxID=1981025 RepID=UPI0026DEB948|nr:hypothetical protein [Sutterella sp.]MDO5531194.1 hypothetical protein [Sutterella sp.]